VLEFILILLTSSVNLANIQTARVDNWTAMQNPATLDQAERFQLRAQYENHAMLAALNTASVQFGYCNPYVNVGVGFNFYGYSKYQEMQVGVNLARRFGRCTLGLGGYYLTLYAGDEIKYKGTFIPTIGLTVDVVKNWTLGVYSYNPFWQKMRITDDEKRAVSSVYSLGSDYRFLPGWHWNVQGDYDPTTTWRVATSIEWQCVQQVIVKIGGYYYEQLVGCLGVGLRFNGLEIDTHFELNPRMGLNIQASVGYRIP